MKKSLLIFLITVTVLLALSSCRIFSKPDDGDDNNGNETVSDGALFASGNNFHLVVGDDVNLNTKLDKIYSEVRYLTGSIPLVVKYTDEETTYEIVVGNCERDVSMRAYRMLDSVYKNIDEESAWAIYVKGTKVCIAYDSEYALDAALTYFIDNCLTKDFGKTGGIVSSGSFSMKEKAAEARLENIESTLNRLESKLGAESIEQLKQLYTLYDESVYKWMANLWCPEIGGFYYSNSGRDTKGFLPDLESTSQVLSFLGSSGLLDSYVPTDSTTSRYAIAFTTDYPEIGEKLLNFAKSLQAEDGYFYHPQWGDSIIASRLGRDLGWGKGIIAQLGGTPNYPYPGDAPEVDLSSGALPERLGASNVSAVSKIVPVNSSLPAYLQSLEKWDAYIKSFDLRTGSYGAGNTLAAQNNMITAAGRQYWDHLINYLDSMQLENGLWEPEITYNSTNGLMKLLSVYGYAGSNARFPRAEKALEACIIITKDTKGKSDGWDHTCDVYNPWYTMDLLLRCVASTEGSAKRDELRQMIYAELPEMLSATFEMISYFRKPDGGFSYYRNTTSYTSQGAVVAVRGTDESDVNATCLSSTGLVGGIERTLGVSLPSFYTQYDLYHFMNTLYDLAPVEKTEAPDPTPVTFDEFYLSGDNVTNGVVTAPDELVQVLVNDKDLDGNNYKWISADITESPDPRHDEDLSLKFSVKTYGCTCTNDPCTCKTIATNASSVWTTTQNLAILANTYVAEFDYYLDSTKNFGVVSQLSFAEKSGAGAAISFNLSAYESDGKTYLRLGDNQAGLDGMKNSNLVDGIPAGEWVRFKFVLYKTQQTILNVNTGEEKDYLCQVTQIYVNDEYICESDVAPISATTGLTENKGVNGFGITGYRYQGATFFVDNINIYKVEKEYKCLENEGEGVLTNMAIDSTKLVADFEDGRTATYYLKNLIGSKGSISYKVTEHKGKNALFIDSNGTAPSGSSNATKVSLSTVEDDGNCYVFESKMYYDIESITGGSTYLTQFSFGNGAGSAIGFSIQLINSSSQLVLQHNGNFLGGSTLASSGYVKDKDGNNLLLPMNEWFTIKIEFYRMENAADSIVKVYIGDGNGENMELSTEFVGYKLDIAIDQFNVSHYRTGLVKLYIDDVSAGCYNKEFKSSIPNPNVESFEFGYENGAGKLSDTVNTDSYTGGDKIEIVKDPKDSSNSVLGFTSTAGESNSVALKYSGSQITHGLSVFETKIYLGTISSGKLAELSFVGLDGAVQSFVIVGADGYAYLALPEGYTVTENTFIESNEKNRISVGEWHTVKLEFNNSTNASEVYSKLYIDGILAAELKGFSVIKNAHTVKWTAEASALSTIYFDDMSLTEALVATVGNGSESADKLETLTPGESFDGLNGKLVGDGSDSNIKYGKGFCDSASLAKTQDDDTVLVTGDPAGGGNKVLMFTDGTKLSSTITSIWASLTNGNEVKRTDTAYAVAVFETKLYIEAPTAETSSTIAQLRFVSGRTQRAGADLYLTGSGENAYAYFVGFGSADSGNKLTCGKWHTLRIEYHNADADKTLAPYIEIFIDGTSVGEVENDKTYEVNGLFWMSYSAGISTVYFDNISYTERAAEYPAEPVIPEEPETPVEPEEPETPVEPEIPTVIDGKESFNNYESGKNYVSHTLVTSPTTGDDTIEVTKNPDDDTDNVLKFVDGSTGSGKFSTVKVTPSTGNVKNGISVFETDIYVAESSSGYMAQIYFVAGNSVVSGLNVQVDSTKSYAYFSVLTSNFTVVTNDGLSSGNAKNRLTLGTWHNLRLEFTNSTDTSATKIELYIDTTLSATIYGYSTSYPTSDVTGFKWNGYNSALSTVFFDDIKFSETAIPAAE